MNHVGNDSHTSEGWCLFANAKAGDAVGTKRGWVQSSFENTVTVCKTFSQQANTIF